MPVIFMFPGQSSRYPEMLERIVDAWPDAVGIVTQASEVLGRDLRALYRDETSFESNRDVQVGVFLTSHLHLRALEAAGVHATASLGLSLGEYNHLVHIGALDFESALRLVDARGRVYDEGPEGMMACIQPASEEELTPLLDQVREHGCVSIANFNSPTQQVIAGDRVAVEATMALCEDELFVQPVVIEKRIPMHTELFRPVAAALRPHLAQAPWRAPNQPYLPNVTAELLDSPRPEDFIDLLCRHVFSPVRWRESIDLLTRCHPDAVFLEVGPRGVLFNLLQKRWHTNRKFKSDSPENLATHLGSLGGELGAAP
jgi:[acyl-carrier-protein] S-malonyltransferase